MNEEELLIRVLMYMDFVKCLATVNVYGVWFSLLVEVASCSQGDRVLSHIFDNVCVVMKVLNKQWWDFVP